MEVREIVETIVREPILEVRFRLDVDNDDVIRVSEFIISEIKDYGYEVITENLDILDFLADDEEEDYQDFEEDEETVVDEDELIAFMNEFFMISGDIPEPEFF